MQKARQGPEATSGVRGGAVGGWKGCKKGPQVSTGSKPRNPKSNFWYLDCLAKVPGQKGNKVPKGALGGRKGCKRGPSPMFTNSRIKEIQQGGFLMNNEDHKRFQTGRASWRS